MEGIRKVLHGRLDKLCSFDSQVTAKYPAQDVRSDVRETREVDLDYYVLAVPGSRCAAGWRQPDEAVAKIYEHAAQPEPAQWEMYFIEGLANGLDRRSWQNRSRAGRWVASANLLARGMDLQEAGRRSRESYATIEARRKGELVRSASR